MSDKYIAISVMLFTFSLITERIANFIKLWLPADLNIRKIERLPKEYNDLQRKKKIIEVRKQNTSRLLKTYQADTPTSGTINIPKKILFVGNLKTEASTELGEKDREAKIVLINIIVGFLVALIVKIDIIYIFNNLSEKVPFDSFVGWKQENLEGTAFIGIPLAGFFLSFGSKFWHDVVDLLYETKKLKKRAADPDALFAGNIEEVQKVTREKEQIEKLIQENFAFFQSLPGFISVQPGRNSKLNSTYKYCIEVFVEDVDSLPNSAPRWISLGAPETQVDIVYLEEASPALSVEEGGKIRNSDSNSFGSLGALVWKSKEGIQNQYIVSCYHVLRSHKHDFYQFAPLSNQSDTIIISDTTNSNVIARLDSGEINNLFDIALARVTDKTKVSDGNKFSRARPVTELDQDAKTSVRIRGAQTTHETIGFIHEVNKKRIPVAYRLENGEKKNHEFDGLIVISSIVDGENKSPAKKGDSGSVIYTNQGDAIGMIVAVNKRYTYVMPMNVIMEYLGIQFC